MTHEFSDRFENGENAETVLNSVLRDSDIPVNDYGRNMEYQRRGIDFGIPTVNGEIYFDTKAREFYYFEKYGDILIEVTSVLQDGKRVKKGWLYTSEADYIAYVFWNKKRSGFVEGYLINLKEFRKKIRGHLRDFRRYKASNWDYDTIFRCIPVADFPSGTIVMVFNGAIFLKKEFLRFTVGNYQNLYM